MHPPRLNAGQVVFVEIARPPRDIGKFTGEFDRVLARAATDLNRVTGFSGKVSHQNTAYGLMVTMKGRCIEPPARFPSAAILSKFNDIVGHLKLPDFVCTDTLSGDSLYALNDYIWANYTRGTTLTARPSPRILLLILMIEVIMPPNIARAQSNVTEGQKLAFDRSKGNCLSCHNIKGGDFPGTIGPALKDIKSKYPDRKDLVAILNDETLRNPQTAMPPFGRNHILTKQEIDAIVDFLQTL
jgi:L-cysteine S-thiosulfotransferase